METIAKGTAVTNRSNGHPATVEAVDLQASQGPSALLRYEANERNGLAPGDHETGWALLADLEVAIRVDAGAEAFGAVFPLRWGADRPIIEALWGEADVRREDSFVFDGAGRFRRVRGPGQPFAPDNPEGFRLVGDPRPASTRVDAFMQPVDLPSGPMGILERVARAAWDRARRVRVDGELRAVGEPFHDLGAILADAGFPGGIMDPGLSGGAEEVARHLARRDRAVALLVREVLCEQVYRHRGALGPEPYEHINQLLGTRDVDLDAVVRACRVDELLGPPGSPIGASKRELRAIAARVLDEATS